MRTLAILSVAILVASPLTAAAADFAEYTALVERATQHLEAVEAASPDEVEMRRMVAAGTFVEVIEWLDAYFAEPEFTEADPTLQAQAYQARFRWEYNLAVQLLALDRCQEASERIGALLDTSIDDPELRPLLVERYDAAVRCVVRQEQAATTEPIAGEEPDREGPAISEPEPPVPSQRGPNMVEIALWSVGGVAIATGAGFFVAGRNRESDLNNPPDGTDVLDPELEQSRIDTLDTVAYVSAGVGLAAAITGTVLFLTRGEEPTGVPQAAFVWTTAGPGAHLSIPF